MKPTVLTICVLSIATRRDFLQEMLLNLWPQITGSVQLLIDIDNGEVAIGTKRNRMLRAAEGEFTTMVDDDDSVNDCFAVSLVNAIRANPDANWFAPACFRIDDGGENAGKVLPWPYPFPGHIGPVRTALALRTGFDAVNEGEDNTYAAALRACPDVGRGVLVPEARYTYRFRRSRPCEITNAGTFDAKKRIPWKN